MENKWTVENYKELFIKYGVSKFKDAHFGDMPKFLFRNDGEFNDHNWNGLDLVRDYCDAVYYGEVKDERVHVIFDDDSWMAVIITENNIYTLYWYKSRGNTEAILKNRHYIDIEEYVELMNELDIEVPELF